MDKWYRVQRNDFFNGVGPDVASDFYQIRAAECDKPRIGGKKRFLPYTSLTLHCVHRANHLIPVNISFLYKHIVSLFHSHPGTVVLLTDCDFVRKLVCGSPGDS